MVSPVTAFYSEIVLALKYSDSDAFLFLVSVDDGFLSGIVESIIVKTVAFKVVDTRQVAFRLARPRPV